MTVRDIIVVGASAGGVEALCTLAAGLSASLPAAVFVVLHIPPHSPSQLASILARAGPLPVETASDHAPIRPGRIYVAVPDRHLLLEGNRIRVPRGPKENRARPAVDVLFRSAAYQFGQRVIGAVLSGNLDDGTAGLWAVKDRGGIALVQTPEEAPFPSMPQSALEHVAVDHVLPVADMPSVINRLSQEQISHPEKPLASESMPVEVEVALGEKHLRDKIMQLGSMATASCPECHGALVRLEEGPIRRYRCHVGHAYSSHTLLAHVNEQIDNDLASALRALEERIFILQEMERKAGTAQEDVQANRYAKLARRSEHWAERVRDMLGDRGIFG